MSSRTPSARSTLAALALLLRTAPAHAEAPFELAWSSPASCPDAAAARRRVTDLLGDRPEALLDKPLRVAAVVEVSGTGASLELTSDHDGTRGHRRLEGATCQEVTAAASLIIALAIDPDAGSRAERAVAGFDSSEDGNLEPADGRTMSPPTDGPGPDRAAPSPSARPTGDSPAKPERRPPAADEQLEVSVQAGAALDTAALPGAALGVGVGAGARASSWRGELLGGFFPSRRAASSLSPDKGGDIALLVAQVRGCWLPVQGRLDLGPCAGVEAGALLAEGTGLRAARSSAEPWLALEAGGTLAWRIREPAAVVLHGGLLVPLGRPAFRFTRSDGALDSVHRPDAVGLRASLGLRLAF